MSLYDSFLVDLTSPFGIVKILESRLGPESVNLTALLDVSVNRERSVRSCTDTVFIFFKFSRSLIGRWISGLSARQSQTLV